MEIERFKHQHKEILDRIAGLRQFAHAGIERHAYEIARGIADLSAVVTRHLAIEDRILYPALQNGDDERLAALGRAYQEDMKGIAHAYITFSRRWNAAAVVAGKAEEFRADANTVLKMLHDRMKRENAEFYPAIEAAG